MEKPAAARIHYTTSTEWSCKTKCSRNSVGDTAIILEASWLSDFRRMYLWICPVDWMYESMGKQASLGMLSVPLKGRTLEGDLWRGHHRLHMLINKVGREKCFTCVSAVPIRQDFRSLGKHVVQCRKLTSNVETMGSIPNMKYSISVASCNGLTQEGMSWPYSLPHYPVYTLLRLEAIVSKIQGGRMIESWLLD